MYHLQDTKDFHGSLTKGEFILITCFPRTHDIYQLPSQPQPKIIAPIVVSPIFSDITPDKILQEIERECRHRVLMTHYAKGTVPTTASFRLWYPKDRDAIMGRSFPIGGKMARVLPADQLPNFEDAYAKIVYASEKTARTPMVIHIIKVLRDRANIPRANTITQFIDIETDIALPKWLLTFNTPEDAEEFATKFKEDAPNRTHLNIVFNIGPCKGPKPTTPVNNSSPRKNQSQGRGGRGGRGRGKRY
jgi:hypothetical protein